MTKISAIKGFEDMFAEDSAAFLYLEKTARDIFSCYGFEELRTPLMEYTDLFCRSIGTETDVVQKEMYSFLDSKGRSQSLRPEATAGVMRAYVEHNIQSQNKVSKYFTTGPMFRHERPQKGRLRQFHQINAECIGANSPLADAEMILMLNNFLNTIQIEDLDLQMNSLGCPECRPKYKLALQEYLESLDSSKLCADCQRRLHSNPLRVLDCKQESCKELTKNAPVLIDYNCEECTNHFTTVCNLLDKSQVKYSINHKLVRGLDYYVRTCFEFVSNKIGSQSAVAGGGRYDGLVEAIGGPKVGGIGFACGMERLAMLMPKPSLKGLDYYLTALDETCLNTAFELNEKLHQSKVHGTLEFTLSSVKSLMRKADKSGAKFALLLGQDEVAKQSIIVKNLENGEQITLDQTQLIEYILKNKE